MTTAEILKEIEKLPYDAKQEISKGISGILKEEDRLDPEERAFIEYLYTKGSINNVPTFDETDEEFDELEPFELEGEPLSEQVIRERR